MKSQGSNCRFTGVRTASNKDPSEHTLPEEEFLLPGSLSTSGPRISSVLPCED